MVIGRKAVTDALESGIPLDRIYLLNRGAQDVFAQIRNLATAQHIPVNYVPSEKLNSFNAGDHEGCVALRSRVQYHELQEVISWVVERGEVPLLLILDGITD